MKCKICNNQLYYSFNTKVLNKYIVSFYYCDFCRFLQSESPFWIQEAYSKQALDLDTGAVNRNLSLAKKTAVIIFYLFKSESIYLDYAGGSGLLTRIMRDRGFNFYWNDLYAENVFARGFEYDYKLSYELLTSFESFEHFIDPILEIEHLLSIADNILFSTILLPRPLPEPDQWWYYLFNSGQHISFYSYETLRYIANKYSLNLCSNKYNIHLLSKKPISNVVFNTLLKLSFVLYPFISLKMKSKIYSDFDLQLNRNNGN